MIKEAIAQIVMGRHLDEQQMTAVMQEIMSEKDNVSICLVKV